MEQAHEEYVGYLVDYAATLGAIVDKLDSMELPNGVSDTAKYYRKCVQHLRGHLSLVREVAGLYESLIIERTHSQSTFKDAMKNFERELDKQLLDAHKQQKMLDEKGYRNFY